MKTTVISPKRAGGRSESASTENRKTEVAPQPQRGGARRSYPTEKDQIKSHTVLCHSRSSQNNQIAPGSERAGIGRTKKVRTRKTDCPEPQLMAPLTRPQPCTDQGGVGRKKNAGTTPHSAQKLRKRILGHNRAA